MMKEYRDANGDSGVTAYECGPDWISVQFKTGAVYEYTCDSTGQHNIEAMKRRADKGDSLDAYINTHVRNLYSRRIS